MRASHIMTATLLMVLVPAWRPTAWAWPLYPPKCDLVVAQLGPDDPNEDYPGAFVDLYSLTGLASDLELRIFTPDGAGECRLTVSYAGTGRISIWEDGVQVHVPHVWDIRKSFTYDPNELGDPNKQFTIRGEAFSSSPGDIVITAEVAYGLTTLSDSVTVTVGNQPVVIFTAPVPGVVQPDEHGAVCVGIGITDPSDPNELAGIMGVDLEVHYGGELLTTLPGHPDDPSHWSFDWTPGVNGAFMLRAVATDRCGATGSASKPITVTDADTPTMPDTLPNLRVWLKADPNDLDLDANNYVAQWFNRGPLEDPNDPSALAMSDQSHKPRWVNDDPNVPAVRFDGDDDQLVANTADTKSNSAIFIVAKVAAGEPNNATLFSLGSRAAQYVNVYKFATAGGDRLMAYNGKSIMAPPSGFEVLTITVTGSEAKFYRNGVAYVDDAPNDAPFPLADADMKTFAGYWLGRNGGGTAYCMACDIAEVIIYRGKYMTDFSTPPAQVPVLTDTQRMTVERYLMSKYKLGPYAGNQAPVAEIVSPPDHATFTAGDAVRLLAAAHYADGRDPSSIDCEFLRNGTAIGSDGDRDPSTGLYELNWTAAPGIHTFRVRASDADPNIPAGDSDAVEVRVFAAEADAAADSDGDGMNDWWELANFATLDADPNDDADGDGVNNIDEFQAHTNPTAHNTNDPNAAAVLAVWPPVGSTVPLPVQGSPLGMTMLFSNPGGGAITVTDQHGNDLTGKLVTSGPTGAELRVDLPRKCLDLTDTDPSACATTADGGFDTGNTFTVCCWVWIPSDCTADGSRAVLANSLPGEHPGFRLFIGDWDNKNRAIVFETCSSGDPSSPHKKIRSSAGAFNFDQWNHLAVVVDRAGGEGSIYLNGRDVSLEENEVHGDFLTTGELDFGSMRQDPNTFLGGRLADVRIYGKLLGAGEVYSVMMGNSLSAAPLRWWKLDEGTGTTAADSSGNGDTAALAGDAGWIGEDQFVSGVTCNYVVTVNETPFDVFFRVDVTLPTVSADITGGRYYSQQNVVLTASEPNCNIYLTTDGLPPTVNSWLYDANDPVDIIALPGNSTVLQFFAVDQAGNFGPVGKEVYFFGDAPPPPTNLTAVHLPGGPQAERVECRWSPPGGTASPLLGYRLYAAGNQLERRLLEDCRAGGHRPPSALRAIPNVIGAANTMATHQGVTPAGTAWYAMTSIATDGTEGTIGELVEVDMSTSQPVAPNEIDSAVARARAWLNSNQAAEGYWGESPTARVRATCQALNALRLCGWAADKPANARAGLMYLRGGWADSNPDLARTIDTLYRYGQDPNWHGEDTRGLHLRLAVRADCSDPNIAIRGWGVQPRYMSDAYSTAWGVLVRAADPNSVPSGQTDNSMTNLAGDGAFQSLTPGRYGWIARGRASCYVSCLAYKALGKSPTDSDWDWITDDPSAYQDSVYDTAAVLLWSPMSSTARSDAKVSLVSLQQPDGSWGRDPFLTGLCLEALLTPSPE